MTNIFDNLLGSLSSKLKSLSTKEIKVSKKTKQQEAIIGKSRELTSRLSMFTKTSPEPTEEAIESIMYTKTKTQPLTEKKSALLNTVLSPLGTPITETPSEQTKLDAQEYLRSGKIESEIEEIKKAWITEEVSNSIKKNWMSDQSKVLLSSIPNMSTEEISQNSLLSDKYVKAEEKWNNTWGKDKEALIPSIETQNQQSLLQQNKKKEDWIKDQIPFLDKAKAVKSGLGLNDLQTNFPDWYKEKEQEYYKTQEVAAYMGLAIKSFDESLAGLLGENKIADMETGQAILGGADPKTIFTSMSLDIINFEDIANIGQDVYTKGDKIYYRGFEIDDEYLSDKAKQTAMVTDLIARFAGATPTYGVISGLIKKGVFTLARAKDVPKILKGAQKLSQGVKWASEAAPVLTELTAFNTMEEITEYAVRKGAGQKYTFNNFIAGIAMGAGMAGTLTVLGKSISTVKLKKLVREMESNVKESKSIESLRDLEFEGIPLKSFFAESRYAYYKKKRAKGLRPGIDKPAPIREKVTVEKIPEEAFASDEGRQLLAEMEEATAGKRLVTEEGEWFGIDSTFPAWVVGKELRSKKLFNKIQEHVLNGTVPTKAAEVRLYKQMREQLLGDETTVKNWASDDTLPWETMIKTPDVKTSEVNTVKDLTEEARGYKTADEFIASQELKQTMRGAKGLTVDQITQKYPDIILKKEVSAKDIYGNKVTIPKGEALTPYEMKGNKVVLQDGATYVVSKNQYQNIKGNAKTGEAKEFAPELKGTEETMKGDVLAKTDADIKWTGTKDNLTGTLGDRTFLIKKESDGYYVAEKDGQLGRPAKNHTDAIETLNRYLKEQASKTKYSSYQLPGGENYKEILIKAPTTVSKLDKQFDEGKITRSEYQKGIMEMELTQSFKSSHWDEPNVIAHVRMNERIYNGKKVTFMEELQSDWAREARSKGFSSEKQARISELENGTNLAPREMAELTRLVADKKLATPQNHLLKNWQELSVKRGLQEAVANDSQYFAWINGEQTSARYNLSTQVDNVNWSKGAEADSKWIKVFTKDARAVDGGKLNFVVDKNGIITQGKAGTSGKRLDEVLGKGLADKIMADESGTLSGEGLKFGGEWASNLYDKQIKNIVEDLTDGKVEELDMDLPVEKGKGWNIANDTMVTKTVVTPDNIKVGLEIAGENRTRYVVTEVLKDGKFNAVSKNRSFRNVDFDIQELMVKKGFIDEDGEFIGKEEDVFADKDILKMFNESDLKETFDISTKKTTQQAIKLTPEIKTKIKSEIPELKKASGQVGEYTKEQLTDIWNKAQVKTETPDIGIKSQEEFSGEQIRKEAEDMGSDQGGFSEYTLDQISKESYHSEDISIAELRKLDPDLDEYLKGNQIREYEGEAFAMDPIVSSKGEVIDGYNRIAQAIANGDNSITILRGNLAKGTDILSTTKQEISPTTDMPTKPVDLDSEEYGNLVSYTDSIKQQTKQAKAIEKTAETLGEDKSVVKRVADSVRKGFLDIQEYFQDSEIRIKRVVNDPRFKVTDLSDPYLKATLYPGKTAFMIKEAHNSVKTAMKDMSATAKEFKTSLTDIRTQVNDYLLYQHAPERNLALGDGAAGVTTKQAEEGLATIKNSPQGASVEKIAGQVLGLNQKTLDILKDSGVISEDLFSTLRNKYKSHVPLQRILEDTENIGAVLGGKGFDVKNTGIKKAKGSKREVNDILSNVITNYEQAVLRSEKNIVDKATLAFVRDNKDVLGDSMEEIQLPIVPVAKIQHKAAIDIDFQDKLVAFAREQGASFKTTGQVGKNLGAYYPGAKKITRKFATPREVLAHETGHFFDDKFELKQKFYKRGDTKPVAEEMLAHMERAGESPARMKKTSERFADSFEWWLTHRDLAKRDMPLFSKAMTKIISDIPELKPILDIEPSPRFTIEEMEETVFNRQKFTNDPTILTMMDNGKPTYIKIKDPALAVAIRGVGREKLGPFLNTIGKFTRVYSGLATRFNPEFALPNKIRDLQETMIYMAAQKNVGIKGAAKTGLRDPSSIKAVSDFIRGKDTPGALQYKEMQAMGGTTGGFGLSTKAQTEINLKSMEKIENSKTRKIADKLVNYVDDWNTLFEDSTRLSVYKQGLASGLSKERAAFLAKEASINFNRMGKGGPVINSLYMFSNASIQGSAKMISSMKDPKVAAAVSLAIGTAVAGVSEWNDSVDPEWRSRISKWDRMNGLPVMLPSTEGDVKYFVIPVSWGVKPIKVMADYAYDMFSGQDVTIKSAVNDTAIAMIEAYNPVGGTDIVSAMLPTFLDVPVEIARNQSWSGSQIRPDWDSNAPKDIQYFDSLGETKTGQVAISLSELLHENLDISVSPADIKYAYDSYIGGAGRTANKFFNLFAGIATGEIPSASEFPFISRFYREKTAEEVGVGTGGGTEALQNLLEEQSRGKFTQKQEAQAFYDEVKELPLAEGIARVDQLEKENPELNELVKGLYEDDQLGLTYEDKLIKQLGVENGERAAYIFGELSNFGTDVEKNAYVADLQDKGVISDNVFQQLKDLKNGVVKESTPKDNQVSSGEYNKNTSVSELKYEAKKAEDEKSMIEIAKLYLEAIPSDPLTAIKTLFTHEQLSDVRGGTAIMERIVQGIDPNIRIDHIIPLEIGGDNSEDNLRAVTIEVWEKNTPVENYLGGLLNENKISEKEAKEAITAFKNGELTDTEVYSNYK